MIFAKPFRFATATFIHLVICGSVAAQVPPTLFPEPLSPRIANYNIDVRLEPQERMLHADELLIWHNKSSDAIRELQFHLYLNAFRNNQSTFMQESGGQLRGFRIARQDGWGFIEVNSFKMVYGRDLADRLQNQHPEAASERMADAVDLTHAMEFIHPDDDNEHDKTVFRVPLPRPLPPGASVAVKMDFTAKLPTPPFARTGAKDEFFFAGQWFPKIGVYIDGAWNTHQFHANSEFFADFGVYNVWMTVPEENVLGATGVEVAVTQNDDGTATHFYHAEDVHDFAWTTSPEFVEVTGTAQDVDVRVLLQPDHAYQGQRHLDAAEVAITYFQDWYGDYPFPNLTIVDPRRRAGGAGGMEYPTLITAGTHYGVPEGIRELEHVIIHEFGHNYWYHLLASNEFEEPWMDEGINTHTDIQIVKDAYGPTGDMLDLWGIQANYLQIIRAAYMFNAKLDPILRKAWEFYSDLSYGINSYAKPGIVLTTLQNYLGHDRMLNVMRQYVKRWRFKHPTSRDFFNVVNEVSGENLDWFFEQAFRTRAVLDYSVASVHTGKRKEPDGFDFTLSTSDGEVAEKGTVEAEAPEEMAESDSAEPEEPQMYFSEVRVRRLGELRFPVELEVVFDNGEVIREQWDGQTLWKTFRYTRPAKLVSASVDPENRIPLDINYTNNSRTVETQHLGINKVSVRWLFWMQFLLDMPEFTNTVYTLTKTLSP